MNEQIRSLCRTRCETILNAMLGEELAKKWWDSRNKAFDMQTPKTVWQTDYESVYRYVLSQNR